jgi:hypothetical protein
MGSGGALGTINTSATPTANVYTTLTNASNNWASSFPTAAFVTIDITQATSIATENLYIDAVALHLASSSSYTAAQQLKWQPGQFPNSDIAPVLHFQYMDEGDTDWKSLADVSLVGEDGIFENILATVDFELKASTTRSYRAFIDMTQNGVYQASPFGAVATAEIALLRSWLHARADPAGTIHQFQYDGNGRSETVDVSSSSVAVEGREYPFAEFDNQNDKSVAVAFSMPDQADRDALMAIAKSRSEVVFRDQRGRGVAGIIGKVAFTDTVWGQTASFTITATGQQ